MMLGWLLLAPAAEAQWRYPRGYGGYGWGGWNASDPAAGYMAGLGSYARGQGVYEVEDAKAQAINLDTMIKWNKALRERQKVLRAEQQKEDAQRAADRNARATEQSIEDGTTLNTLLAQIYDFDPGAVRSTRAKTVIGATAIREIPFEWDTEAITICIDQMTAQGALPSSLDGPRFVEEKNALRLAISAALKEEAKGNVSAATKKRVASAISAFHAKFVKEIPDFDSSYMESEQYFITLGSLTRMLNDPSMQKILAQLGSTKEVPVGDLIAFMHSYNLRFAPATTARQIDIYRALVQLLTQVSTDVSVEPAPAPTADRDGKKLQSAAKAAFQGMKWKQLDAQTQEP
ncbi:MAG: hypothetical protein P4L84_28070 [Isosphaeraceae bacterium]|nr:hypothetical protein [Isosphaeraceae bacterium]